MKLSEKTDNAYLDAFGNPRIAKKASVSCWSSITESISTCPTRIRFESKWREEGGSFNRLILSTVLRARRDHPRGGLNFSFYKVAAKNIFRIFTSHFRNGWSRFRFEKFHGYCVHQLRFSEGRERDRFRKGVCRTTPVHDILTHKSLLVMAAGIRSKNFITNR